MPKPKKPRKRYKARPVYANASELAMNSVTKLSADEVEQGAAAAEHSFDQFADGVEPAFHWAVMAEAMNVAEQLAAERICSDEASRQTIADAQKALARLHQQHKVLGSWAMWDDDRKALAAGIDLHRLQLTLCDYAEYRRAIETVIRRMKAARAGNVSKGTTILEACN